MLQSPLGRRIVILMTTWGSAGGALAGAIYGVLVFAVAGSSYLAPVGAIAGFLAGGMVGLALGFLDGVAVKTVTDIASRCPASSVGYRTAMYTESALLTASGSLLLFSAIAIAISNMDSQAYLFYALIPTAIALAVALAASTHVIQHVEKARTS